MPKSSELGRHLLDSVIERLEAEESIPEVVSRVAPQIQTVMELIYRSNASPDESEQAFELAYTELVLHAMWDWLDEQLVRARDATKKESEIVRKVGVDGVRVVPVITKKDIDSRREELRAVVANYNQAISESIEDVARDSGITGVEP